MSTFWKETVRATVLDRIRRTITVPAFSIRSSDLNGSYFFTARQTGGLSFGAYTTAAQSLKDKFTIEAWFNTYSDHSSPGVIFCNVRNVSGGTNVKLELKDRKFFVSVLKGSATSTLTSAANYNMNKWTHVAVVYDGTSVKIYQDGVLDANSLAIAANLDSDVANLYGSILGASESNDHLFIGNLGEVRIWGTNLTHGQIIWNYNKRRGKNANLLRYYRLNESAGTVVNIAHDWLNPSITSNISVDEVVPDANVYPPLILGASFIAARFSIPISTIISLKHPVKKPSGANFMLVVSWGDNRFKLWDMDGVDIMPALERYRNKAIDENFFLEVWNVDGFQDCVMEEDLVIDVSLTDIPTAQNITTPQIYTAEPEINFMLGQNFPLTPFPLTFGISSFGTVDSPVSQAASANHSSNLTLYGSAEGGHH